MTTTYFAIGSWSLIAVLLIGAHDSARASGGMHIDSQRNFRAVVPKGWRLQTFAVGPVALQIEQSQDDLYGQCTLTVIDWPKLNEPQTWIDDNVNAEPIADSHLVNLVRKLESETDSKLYGYYPTFLNIGGKKTSALFYDSSMYSTKLKTTLFFSSFFTQYSRTSDHIAVTCQGGGANKLSAAASFKQYNAAFIQFITSIKTNR